MFNVFNFFFKPHERGFFFNKNSVFSNKKSFFFFFLKKTNVLDFFLLSNGGAKHLTFVLFNYRFGFFILKKKTSNNGSDSLSWFLPSLEWYERELSEFSFFFFKNLKDSRSLLTPYSFSLKKNSFFSKTNNCIFFNFFFKKLFFFKKKKITL